MIDALAMIALCFAALILFIILAFLAYGIAIFILAFIAAAIVAAIEKKTGESVEQERRFNSVYYWKKGEK